MKVLSWDVGIINLAYCLLDVEKKKITFKNPNNNENIEKEEIKYTIHHWGLIDLSKKKLFKCQVCNKNACLKYLDVEDEKEKYFCKTHAKKYNCPIIKSIAEFFTEPSQKISCDLCDKDCKRCYKNHNFCSTHGRLFYQKLSKDIELKPIKKEKTNFDIDKLRRNLVEVLETKTELFQAEKVLIENQPSLKNPRMKAISSTIYDYYLIRGIFDKKFDSKINQVKYMSPSNKIKLSKDKKLVKEADKTKKYKLTKKLAVDYVKALLDSDLNNFKDYFLNEKKKDDLADAFLQGAYYLTKFN